MSRYGDGSIEKRGGNSYRLRYSLNGKRYAVPFRGALSAAKKELRRILSEGDKGIHVAPERIKVGEYLRQWLDADAALSPKTRERYRQLAERQIIPYLGNLSIQKLRPVQVEDWMAELGQTGLAPRTVGHARRLLHTAFARALRREEIARNVVSLVRPPKVEAAELEIIRDVPALLQHLAGHRLRIIAAVALTTGMRRGELCALAWHAVDLDKGVLHVRRSLEETEAGLRFKQPKSRAGRRTIGIPETIVEMLRAHRTAQKAEWMRAGLRPQEDLVFPYVDGCPYKPDTLSRDWWRAGLGVSFHALRHSHASALIAAGVDIVTVSKRLGHSSPAITLGVYAHLFNKTDDAVARAIEHTLKPGPA